jgi:hypothetical protein
LVPCAQDAEEFAAVAEDEEEFFLGYVSTVWLKLHIFIEPSRVRRWCEGNVLSVKSRSCAAVVNIWGGSWGAPCGGSMIGGFSMMEFKSMVFGF